MKHSSRLLRGAARLQAVQKIRCALRVGGCAEDRTLVFLQDVQVLSVGSGSADLWLQPNVVAQVEWYADHGGIVLLKMQPGSVQQKLPAGGGS